MEDNVDRRSYRFTTYMEVELYKAHSIVSLGTGQVTNISTGGISFQSKIHFENNDLIQIGFILDNGEIIEINSRILRENKIDYGYEYGVKFEDNPEHVKNKIEEFISSKTK